MVNKILRTAAMLGAISLLFVFGGTQAEAKRSEKNQKAPAKQGAKKAKNAKSAKKKSGAEVKGKKKAKAKADRAKSKKRDVEPKHKEERHDEDSVGAGTSPSHDEDAFDPAENEGAPEGELPPASDTL